MSRTKRKTKRLYFRPERGWYADLRDYRRLGGRREAMIPPGARRATQDYDEAVRLLTRRLEALEELQRTGVGAPGREPRLADYARRHLELKAGYRRAATVEREAHALERVLAYLGPETRLAEVSVQQLSAYVAARCQQRGVSAGRTVAAATVLRELGALSSLYRRAVAEDFVVVNPVARLVDRPSIERPEAAWLELGEAARLLRVAGELDAEPARRAIRFLRPLLATFLLTGARRGEVFGLEVGDVDGAHGVVHIRENAWRRLKRPRHRRTVPLWPQLDTILTEYLEQSGWSDGLLFPAPGGGVLRDVRGSLAAALERAGITTRVTWHTFRHTYTAARLQTTDHGAPVSPYTVMRELGHTSLELIERTYGHLLRASHRAEVVEYREARVLALGKSA